MLKKLDKSYVDFVNSPLDKALIRKDYGGNKYITGYTVVRMLNEATNGAWSWKIEKYWIEEVKDKKGTHEIHHMIGLLTMYFDDGNGNIVKVEKHGTAGKDMNMNVKNAENIYKALESLCLRKAASYAGIGAELWLNDDELDAFDAMSEDAEMAELWPEEEMEKHADGWDFIAQLCADNHLSDEDLDLMVGEWDKQYPDVNHIPPERFEEFIAFLKEASQEDTSDTETDEVAG